MGVESMWAPEPVLRDCEHTGIPVELVRQHLAAGAPVISMMNIESNIVQVAMVVQRYLAGSDDTDQPHRQRAQADIRGGRSVRAIPTSTSCARSSSKASPAGCARKSAQCPPQSARSDPPSTAPRCRSLQQSGSTRDGGKGSAQLRAHDPERVKNAAISTSTAHNTMAPATAGTPECSIEYIGLPHLLDDHRSELPLCL
jgi:hypothetical protein